MSEREQDLSRGAILTMEPTLTLTLDATPDITAGPHPPGRSPRSVRQAHRFQLPPAILQLLAGPHGIDAQRSGVASLLLQLFPQGCSLSLARAQRLPRCIERDLRVTSLMTSTHVM